MSPLSDPKMEVKTTESATQDEIAKKVIDLLSGAKESVCMTTTLYPDFYQERQPVRDAMINAAKRCNGSFNLILDKEADPTMLESKVPYVFELAKQGLIHLYQSQIPVPHWLIVDNRDARIEKPHDFYQPSGRNLLVKNMTPDLSEALTSSFDEMLAVSKKIVP